MKTKGIDMLHGSIIKNMILFALPIALSGMLQQLFNLADTAVVGRFADTNALAAVGTNGEIVALIVSFSSGLAVGVNVLTARMIGKGIKTRIQDMIKISILVSTVLGIGMAVLGLIFSKPILALINTPKDILEAASNYLKIYLIGYPFLLLYDFTSAILRGEGDSKRPLLAMIFSGVINVFLNIVFVLIFHMGVIGVALATDIATVISSLLTLYWVIREFGIPRDHIISVAELKNALAIGVPAALQGAVFCFANIFVQMAVNSFGASVIAGATAAMNYEYLTYYIITSFGQAATTFTGQNFAAGFMERCRKIAWTSVGLSFIMCGIFTTPLSLFSMYSARVFSADAAVIQAASLRMMTILLYEPLCAIYESLAGSLRGRGVSLLPAVMTIVGTCMFRISWILTIFEKIHTEHILYMAFPISWVITSILMIICYNCKKSVKILNI